MINEKAARILVYIMLVLLAIYAFCSYAIAYEQKSISDISNVVVLTLTLMVLVIYAWDTHRIADLQQKSFFTPSVGHEFEDTIWQNNECEICLTLFNYSAYDVNTQVNLDIHIDGQKIRYQNIAITRAYQGDSRWIMCPKVGNYRGHFKFGSELFKQNGFCFPSYDSTELQKHKIRFILSYKTYHKFDDKPFESMKYRYRLDFYTMLIKLNDEKSFFQEYVRLVPLVEVPSYTNYDHKLPNGT